MATAPSEVRRIFNVVTDAGLADLEDVARSGSPSTLRARLMAATPLILSHYTQGTAALAAEWYDELRAAALTRGTFRASPVVDLDQERIRRTVLWATQPVADDPGEGLLATITRLTPRAQEEIGRGFWDTIEGQSKRDPESVGWRRETRLNACGFCRMLADRGAVYRAHTANFAAHKSCHCVAVPVFSSQDVGPEASVMQYVASQRRRSPAQQAELREYLRANYGD